MGLLSDIWISRKPLTGFALMALFWAAFFAQMPVIKAAIDASDGVYGTAMLVASLAAVTAMWLAPFADRAMGRWALSFAALALAFGMLVILRHWASVHAACSSSHCWSNWKLGTALAR